MESSRREGKRLIENESQYSIATKSQYQINSRRKCRKVLFGPELRMNRPMQDAGKAVDRQEASHYRGRVNDSPESKTSPYEAPEASLDAGEDSGVISAKALHYLVSSKWWMMIASVALMANGVFTVVAVFFTLIKAEG